MQDNRIPKMIYPRVSVVLLVYNQAPLLELAVKSFFNQNFTEFELIACDDCSTDESFAILNQLQLSAPSHVDFKVYRHQKNQGLINNYNFAVSMSSGDLIFSAAGDDISEPDRLKICVEEWIAKDSKPDLIATDLLDMNYDGSVLGKKIIDDLSSVTICKWMNQRPYHAGASHMVTRRLVQAGPLNPDVRFEDQALLYRALLMGGATRVDQCLVRHRRGGMSAKRRPLTYQEKKTAWIQSTEDAMREFQHYLHEAETLQGPNILIDYLKNKILFFQQSRDQLQSDRFVQQIIFLLTFGKVNFTRRLRIFLFIVLKPIYALLYQSKINLRK